MDRKSVVLVSHELSLSGGPLLLMELGSVLRRSGAHVLWVTGNKKETTSDPMVVSLERKLLSHELQILPASGTRTVKALTTADLVILNTAASGKWVDRTLKGEVKKVLAKTLWWIHEMLKDSSATQISDGLQWKRRINLGDFRKWNGIYAFIAVQYQLSVRDFWNVQTDALYYEDVSSTMSRNKFQFILSSLYLVPKESIVKDRGDSRFDLIAHVRWLLDELVQNFNFVGAHQVSYA